MPIAFKCPGCGKSMSLEERLSGRTLKCRHCSTTFQVPQLQGTVESASGEAPIGAGFDTRAFKSAMPAARRNALWLVAAAAPVVLVAVGILIWQMLPEEEAETRPSYAHSTSPKASLPATVADSSKPAIHDPPPPEDPVRPPPEDKVANPEEPRTTPISADRIYQRVLKSTVWILGNKSRGISSGSGSLVHLQQRLVLTNDHVVDDANEVLVFFPVHKAEQLITEPLHYVGDKSLGTKGKVVARDSAHDLALVQLESLPEGSRALSLARTSPSPGHNVHSIGASGVDGRTGKGTLWRYTPGQVKQVYRHEYTDSSRKKRDTYVVETTSPVNPGDSGGPVVNDRVQLVAVVAAFHTQERLVSANIDIREVRALLTRHFESMGLKWEDSGEEGLPEERITVLTHIKNLAADPLTRSKAALALGEMGPDAKLAVPGLLKAFKEGDDLFRKIVLETLAKIGVPAVTDIPELCVALKDEDKRLRNYAISSLQKMGQEARSAVPTLIEATKDSDDGVRRTAVQILGTFGADGKTAVPALMEALKDMEVEVRRNAVRALAGLGSSAKAAAPALAGAVRDGDEQVRRKAMETLAGIGPDASTVSVFLQALVGEDSEMARVAAGALEKCDSFGKSEVPLLRRAVKSQERSVRMFAVQAFGKIGTEAREAVPDLILVARTEDKDLRIQATQSLGAIGPEAKAAVPFFLEALNHKDTDKELVSAINAAIVRFGSAAVPGLLNALEDRNPLLRAKAAEVLGLLEADAKEAIPSLIKTLKDEAGSARAAASQALSKIGQPAVKDLIRLLSDRDQALRVRAMQTLGQIGPDAKEAIPALNKAAMDEDETVRVTAKVSLDKIRGKR